MALFPFQKLSAGIIGHKSYIRLVLGVYKGHVGGIDRVQCVVLGGALSATAIFRYLGGCIWGTQGVS